MGVDICSMGNHNLDTSNIEIVARQLSEIFKINIKLGYQIPYDFDEKGMVYNDSNYELKIIDEIVFSEGSEWFLLVDELHFASILLEKYSDEYVSKINDSELDDWEKSNLLNLVSAFKSDLKKYELFEQREGDSELYDMYSIDIMKDYLSISIDDPFRWYGFVENLKSPDYTSFFRHYIQKVREYYQKVGGTEIIYFPDQGTSQLIWDRYEDSLWKEIKKYALEKKYYEDYALGSFSEPELEKSAKDDLRSKDKFLVVNIPETLRTENWFRDKDILEILYDDMSEF